MTITSKTIVKKHLRTFTEKNPHKCGICNKTFSQAATLERHTWKHTSKRFFNCNHCSKSFTYKLCMETHMRMHTGEKPFTCNICNQSFSHAVALRKHNVKTHPGEKMPYRCFMRFYEESHHKIYTRTHTRENPFKCSICKRTFS